MCLDPRMNFKMGHLIGSNIKIGPIQAVHSQSIGNIRGIYDIAKMFRLKTLSDADDTIYKNLVTLTTSCDPLLM
jgi:hypothetical protein